MSKNLKRITIFLVAAIGFCFYGGAASAASDAHCAASWAQIKSTKSALVVRTFLKPCGASAVAANARALLAKLQTPLKTVSGEKPVRRPRVIETINVSQDMTGQQLMSAASRLKSRNEYARARTAYEYGCLKDYGESCYNLAFMYYDTKYGSIDYIKYLEFLKKSCISNNNSDYNKGFNCSLYADRIGNDKFGAPNFELSKQTHERACFFNVPLSCRNAGVMYALDKYGTKDDLKYKILIEKSCLLKSASGCDQAWRRFLDKDKDIVNAIKYFDFSVDYDAAIVPFCTNGWDYICVKLADAYVSELPGKTLSRKLKLYDSACQAKSQDACEKARKLRGPDIFKAS